MSDSPAVPRPSLAPKWHGNPVDPTREQVGIAFSYGVTNLMMIRQAVVLYVVSVPRFTPLVMLKFFKDCGVYDCHFCSMESTSCQSDHYSS